MSIRAAQYVRMSTEHQQYSTENQADVRSRHRSARARNPPPTFVAERDLIAGLAGKIVGETLACLVGSDEPRPRANLVRDQLLALAPCAGVHARGYGAEAPPSQCTAPSTLSR